MQVGATSVAPPELWEAILFPPHPLLATLSDPHYRNQSSRMGGEEKPPQ